ncbi:succinate dehydrogenase subunit 7B, mitochondrial-like [Senna tora]|uniref:Succinate dehydrogenase subunit 7B, mitochondrial-like n=1 Tax=Senna tora TaxID=362788 RepID=A0A834SRJ9_9FABA|nr:succinate dehydrogenase subunit 7B, mitochondrial-like [Senna tora]
MAFFLNNTRITSLFRSQSQLLAEDASLKPFKSYKKDVKLLKRVGDVLTIIVVAVSNVVTGARPVWEWISFSTVYRKIRKIKPVLIVGVGSSQLLYMRECCCYEIYVKAVMREEARKKAKSESAQ